MKLREHFSHIAEKTLETLDLSDTALPVFEKTAASLSRVKEFIEKYPIISKIYALSHLVGLWGMAATIPSLSKQGRNISVEKGGKRLDASMKMSIQLSKLTGYVSLCAIALETFKMGERLGSWGLQKAQGLYSMTGAWLDTIVLVGTLLSAAQIIIDGRKAWKRDQLLQEFQEQAFDYTRFKNYLEQMTPDQEKRLGKALGVDGAELRQKLLEDMPRTVPSGGDVVKTKKCVNLLMGKIRTSRSLHVVTALTGAISFAGSIALLFPPLHPLAGVLIIAAAVATVASKTYGQIKQYQFEDRLNLIERNGKRGLLDFTKWQLGWYHENSNLKRFLTASSKSSEIGIAFGHFVTALFKGVGLSKKGHL